MNSKSLQTLEFDKIIKQLVNFASSDAGKRSCANLKPSSDLTLIEEAQQQTSDALTRIYRVGSLSLSGLTDIRASMKRLEIGGSLNIPELLHIQGNLNVAKRATRYNRGETNIEHSDVLTPLFAQIQPLTPVYNEIDRCILSEDDLADDASPTLKSIRRKIHTLNDRIRSQMSSLLISQSNHLQDNVITMRDGRYCLPVKSDSKGQVPGMVHDQSSSGSTFFIEPMAVVKMNNELTSLYGEEQDEIQVILANLSNLVGEYTEELLNNQQILIQLDFIFAKGGLAQKFNGVKPIFNDNHNIRLRKARHPLIDPHQVVPIDVRMGESFNLLIITGPNTGGKTVTLKTVGLLTLMGQAGLHIPAGDRSELGLFKEVYADIGDEQSIEQSLSTFSAHMVNITRILHDATQDSLVLFDELCSGTDPTEGAALAISILNDLLTRNIRGMATTHYSEIKLYALTTDRVENACCEFDLATLSPTYRLLIGIPGKSNAFAISHKLGLPSYLIEDAKQRLDQETEDFEDVLAQLEQSRISIEATKVKVEAKEREVESLREQLAKKQDNITKQREQLLQTANEEAHAILRDAKSLADETIKNFNQYASESPSIRQMEQQRSKVRSQMTKAEKSMSLKQSKPHTSSKPLKLHIGDKVRVHSLNLTGIVHSLPDARGNLFVQMGILRSSVNLSDLSLIDEGPTIGQKGRSKTSTGKLKMSKSASVSMELNLIGKTSDEAIALLDKYLDDAYLAHLPSVRIVHGKGTGVLRTAVQQHLKRQKYVKSYHLGAFGEGDAGVTIVDFE